jgi:hypothetical protein
MRAGSHRHATGLIKTGYWSAVACGTVSLGAPRYFSSDRSLAMRHWNTSSRFFLHPADDLTPGFDLASGLDLLAFELGKTPGFLLKLNV